MQAMVWSTARQLSRSAMPDQQRPTVRVLLSAEQVLHDSTVIEGVLDALFERLPTTRVVLWVGRPARDGGP
jgi:hypothetical protein